jgi:hypothetical protein
MKSHETDIWDVAGVTVTIIGLLIGIILYYIYG